MKKEEKILLDRKGYERHLQEIENLKAELREVNRGRKDAFDAGAGDGWDTPEFEEIERQEARIIADINRRVAELARIEIVEKEEVAGVVDIDDIVRLQINGRDDDRELFKLVASSPNFMAPIHEVSVNSPIGAAIYKQNIGATVQYAVRDRKFSATILEIVPEAQAMKEAGDDNVM